MREFELNTIMGVIADPEKNALDLSNPRLMNNLVRLINVMQINKNQCNKHRLLSLRNMATMHLVLSNN